MVGFILLTFGLWLVLSLGNARAAVTSFNPFAVNAGFTVVGQGDVVLNNGELEGAVAAFGSIASGREGFPLVHLIAGQSDYHVPTIDGRPVRLLADRFVGTGSFDLTNRGATASDDLNATIALASVTGLTGSARSGGVGEAQGRDFLRVTNPAGGYIEVKPVPYSGSALADLQTERSAVIGYFGDVDGQVAQTNKCLNTMYGQDELAHPVTVTKEGGLVYVSDFATDRPNVIDYADIAGATVKLDRAGGYQPTADAPLVIRVPAGTTRVSALNVEGWDPSTSGGKALSQYLMLDLSQVTGTVTFDGLTLGAIWAPSANLAFDSGVTTNGQWFGQNITTSGGGEIHHYSFGGRLLCGSEPSPTPSTATPTAPTETPTAPTETPTAPTETPTAPTETPTAPTETPTTPSSTVPTDPSGGTTTPTTTLPQTGSSASLTGLWVGAALVIVGLTALIGARLAKKRN